VIAEFLSFLSNNKVIAQIDFGNSFVAIATIILAFVSLFVSLRSLKSNNINKIAEFREQWITDVRNIVAEHQKISYFLSHNSFLHEFDSGKFVDRISEMTGMEHRIQLFLNPNEKFHNDLVILMKLSRRISMEIVNTSDKIYRLEENDESYEQKSKDLTKELHKIANIAVDVRGKVSDAAKKALKYEWDKLKTEMLSRGIYGKIKIRMLKKKIDGKKYDWKNVNDSVNEEYRMLVNQ
jgi:hypothetical protein